MPLTPIPAPAALDQFFHEARAKLLDVAAILDRIDRGADAPAVQSDPRLGKVREALELIRERGDGRAERLQQLFSLTYDASWPRPQPR